MNHSEHLNPSEETGTGCPVTSKYGRTPPNKHGGVVRQQLRYLIRLLCIINNSGQQQQQKNCELSKILQLICDNWIGYR